VIFFPYRLLTKTKQNKQTSETHNTLNKRRSVLLPSSSSDNEIAPLQISSRLQFGVNISFNRDCGSVLVPRSYIYLVFFNRPTAVVDLLSFPCCCCIQSSGSTTSGSLVVELVLVPPFPDDGFFFAFAGGLRRLRRLRLIRLSLW